MRDGSASRVVDQEGERKKRESKKKKENRPLERGNEHWKKVRVFPGFKFNAYLGLGLGLFRLVSILIVYAFICDNFLLKTVAY